MAVVAALIGSLCGLGVIALAFGATLDPTASAYAAIATSLWTTFGPHFIIVAVLSLLLGLLSWRLAAPRLGRVSAIVSVAALIAAGLIVWQIVTAVRSAGGAIDLVSALRLAPMDVPPPDAVETAAVVDGGPLSTAIYKPPGAAGAAPVMVYIHGGGFMTDTTTETAADLRYFADRGYLVFSLDYRLFAPGRPTWDKAPVDVACGLAAASAAASGLGGDPGRIVLMGDSAGGNLAINLAYGAAAGRAHSDCGAVPVPRAVVVQYPAVDPIAIYERGYPIPGFEPKMLMEGYIGGRPDTYPDRVRAVASQTYLSPKAPPTLVIAPEKDGLVVSDSVYAFAAKAKAAGVAMTLVRIPFANHVYNQIAANSLGNQARRSITLNYLAAQGLGPAGP